MKLQWYCHQKQENIQNRGGIYQEIICEAAISSYSFGRIIYMSLSCNKQADKEIGKRMKPSAIYIYIYIISCGYLMPRVIIFLVLREVHDSCSHIMRLNANRIYVVTKMKRLRTIFVKLCCDVACFFVGLQFVPSSLQLWSQFTFSLPCHLAHEKTVGLQWGSFQ